MNKPVVLFLCTGNAARSQMAEALLRHLAGDRFEVHSAGTDPKGVHPLALEVLQEVGVETRGLRSKPLTEYLGKLPVRFLIVVCEQADGKCPTAWPGVVHRLFWPFPDPARDVATRSDSLTMFRDVRDQLQVRLSEWLAALP